MQVEKFGAAAIAVQADLSDEQAVRRVVEATLTRFGRLDVLVNCAGAWNHLSSYCLASYRTGDAPYRDYIFGCRLARVPSGSQSSKTKRTPAEPGAEAFAGG